MPNERPPWAARIRSERKERGWSAEEMARRLRDAADPRTRDNLPQLTYLIDYVRRWERGGSGVTERYRLLYARAFGLDDDELFGDLAPHLEGPALPDESVEIIEFMRKAEESSVGSGALDVIHGAIDRLCRDYPTMPAPQLRDRCKTTMRHVLGLLDERTTLAQHRELLVSAGWLAALLGCVYFDLGDRDAAENARRVAFTLGGQAGHGEVVGWAWEMAAWFALVEGRYGDVVAAAQAGQGHAGVTSAAVQLALQEAKGRARMGDSAAADSLKSGGRLLQALPAPDHPEHHFVFDHSKYEFYAATIYTWLGQDDAAEEHAHEVVRQCEQPNGIRWPMRLADARIDLALIAGRRGDLDEAIHYGRAAFEFERRSASLLSRASDLVADLRARYRDAPIIGEYRDQLVEERRALPPPDPCSTLHLARGDWEATIT